MNKAAGGIGYKQVACEVHTVLLSGFSLVCGAGTGRLGMEWEGMRLGGVMLTCCVLCICICLW